MTILTIIYLCVILGVAYNHVTSFFSIRYLYLGYIYIVQSLFIMLSISFKLKKCDILKMDRR